MFASVEVLAGNGQAAIFLSFVCDVPECSWRILVMAVGGDGIHMA